MLYKYILVYIILYSDYISDYILYMYIKDNRRTNKKYQASIITPRHYNTASIITPRHYNTQFNDNQASQIRR